MISDNSNIKMEDVRQYLQMLHEIINRMASNSSNCKTWAITLFSAMAALLISLETMRQLIWLLIIPIVLFYLLDAYYLGLEKGFRDLETSFVNKLHSSGDCSLSVYNFKFIDTGGYNGWKNLGKGLLSKSTWPLYSILLFISVTLSFVYSSYTKKDEKAQQLEEPLHQLVIKQDSISRTLKSVVDKYEQQNVDSKTYYNSSFYRANNVDSVEVKVFDNK